jgi:hypothetical protein
MGIHGYDIGQEYVDRSRALTPSPRCTFMLGAITSAHLFEDDLGQVPRAEAITLSAQFCHVKKRSRSDWRGSHTMVKGDLPADTVWKAREVRKIEPLVTLEEALDRFGSPTMEVTKFDCDCLSRPRANACDFSH